MLHASKGTVEALVVRGQAGHASRQLIQSSLRGINPTHLTIGGSKHDVDVGKFRIGFGGEAREFDCPFVSLR